MKIPGPNQKKSKTRREAGWGENPEKEIRRRIKEAKKKTRPSKKAQLARAWKGT